LSSTLRTPWSNRIEDCQKQFSSRRNQKIRREIVSLMDNPENVLEVGCGTKELKRHLDCDYVGLDFEPEFKPSVVADARDLPFGDRDFDTVVTKNCLQHIPSYERALSEIIRVASRCITLAERVWNKPTQIVSKTPVLRRRFNPSDLIHPLREFGEVRFNLSRADERVGIIYARSKEAD